MIKNAQTYEIMTRRTSARRRPLSCLANIPAARVLEAPHRAGYPLEGEALVKAFNEFKKLADRKKAVHDADLITLASDERTTVTELWALETLQVVCGTTSLPTATVRLRDPDGKSTATPPSAPVRSTGYKASTPSSNARHAAGIRGQCGHGRHRRPGRGLRPRPPRGAALLARPWRRHDIVVASAKAYIASLNHVLSRQSAAAASIRTKPLFRPRFNPPDPPCLTPSSHPASRSSTPRCAMAGRPKAFHIRSTTIAHRAQLDELGDVHRGRLAGLEPEGRRLLRAGPDDDLESRQDRGLWRNTPGQSDTGRGPQHPALVDAGTEVCAIFGKSSVLQVKEVLRTTLEENLKMIEDTVSYLRGQGSGSSTTRAFLRRLPAEPAYALQTLQAAVKGGAETIALCDTNGGSLPWQVEAAVREVIAQFGRVPVGIHAHDDTGCGVANTLAAVRPARVTCRARSTATASAAATPTSASSSPISS